jgi:hypothetical protein
VAVGTVKQFDFEKCRSSIDNKYNQDEIVILTDKNPFSKEGVTFRKLEEDKSLTPIYGKGKTKKEEQEKSKQYRSGSKSKYTVISPMENVNKEEIAQSLSEAFDKFIKKDKERNKSILDVLKEENIPVKKRKKVLKKESITDAVKILENRYPIDPVKIEEQKKILLKECETKNIIETNFYPEKIEISQSPEAMVIQEPKVKPKRIRKKKNETK